MADVRTVVSEAGRPVVPNRRRSARKYGFGCLAFAALAPVFAFASDMSIGGGISGPLTAGRWLALWFVGVLVALAVVNFTWARSTAPVLRGRRAVDALAVVAFVAVLVSWTRVGDAWEEGASLLFFTVLMGGALAILLALAKKLSRGVLADGRSVEP